MLRKVWRTIKREAVKLHNDERGVADWGLIGAGAASGIGAGLTGNKQPKYEQNWPGRYWAQSMGRKYPELQQLQLPGIAPEAAQLISNLMSGQLPQGVSQALGGGAERAYGSALSGLSDIGAGPATLAGMRSGIMGQLGEQKAMLGWQGMQAGLGAVPQISELMMQPQKWSAETQQRKWTDIANMYIQSGAAKLKPGQEVKGGFGGW